MNELLKQNNENTQNSKLDDIRKQKTELDKSFNSIQNDIKNSIFVTLKNIEGQLLFKYIIIFIVAFKSFEAINFTTTIFIAILFAFGITYINYDKDKVYTSTKKKNLDFKLNNIYPKPTHFKNHNNLIEFVYSIKEFREYNDDSFDKMIKCIDNILQLYKDINIGTVNTNHHVDIIRDNKQKAVNYLHSIIHTMETSTVIVNKHTTALHTLDSILDYYLQKSIKISNIRLKKHGYNTASKYIYNDELDGIHDTSLNSNVYDHDHFSFY